MPSYGLVDASYRMRLQQAASNADGPVYMLSLTRFRPGSGQVPGRGSGQDPDSRPVPIPLLTAVQATLCFLADVVAGTGGWHRVGVIRFPTRRAFVELSDRRELRDWVARKERRAERMIMVGLVPAGPLPGDELYRRVLLEIWNGPEPDPVTAGPAAQFAVEGTFIGDGRQWRGVRYTPIEPGTALPVQPPRSGYQAVLVDPVIERWP